MIPCGQVTYANGATHDLIETTKNAPQHAQFTVNDVRSEMWLFYVADKRTCNFFRSVYPGYLQLLLSPNFEEDKILRRHSALLIGPSLLTLWQHR